MAKAYREGSTWSIRTRAAGQDVYLAGFDTKAAAEKEARRRWAELEASARPRHCGPDRTTLAQALQDYALAHLPELKGAGQEARRINRYLLAAGLETVVVLARKDEALAPAGARRGAYFMAFLKAHDAQRVVPKGLGAHRKRLLTKTADSDAHREALARTRMADVSREAVGKFMNALGADGCAPATVHLERALLRALFNYAKAVWNWAAPAVNPATQVRMPRVGEGRQRVLSLQEQTLLDTALQACRNTMVAPVLTLLRETAMRSSEPLERARWGDVDWERRILTLPDSKSGKRNVPLSQAALDALRALNPGEPDEPIVKITYEALKAAWKRSCERAGLTDLKIHDLRHTAATRMALKTGNFFIVKALTGHKTIKMLERYVHVTADDVVNVMHDGGPTAVVAPAGSAPGEVAIPLTTARSPKDTVAVGLTPPARETMPEPVVPSDGGQHGSLAAPAADAGSLISITPEQLQALVSQAVALGLAAHQGAGASLPTPSVATAPVVAPPRTPVRGLRLVG